MEALGTVIQIPGASGPGKSTRIGTTAIAGDQAVFASFEDIISSLSKSKVDRSAPSDNLHSARPGRSVGDSLDAHRDEPLPAATSAKGSKAHDGTLKGHNEVGDGPSKDFVPIGPIHPGLLSLAEVPGPLTGIPGSHGVKSEIPEQILDGLVGQVQPVSIQSAGRWLSWKGMSSLRHDLANGGALGAEQNQSMTSFNLQREVNPANVDLLDEKILLIEKEGSDSGIYNPVAAEAPGTELPDGNPSQDVSDPVPGPPLAQQSDGDSNFMQAAEPGSPYMKALLPLSHEFPSEMKLISEDGPSRGESIQMGPAPEEGPILAQESQVFGPQNEANPPAVTGTTTGTAEFYTSYGVIAGPDLLPAINIGTEGDSRAEGDMQVAGDALVDGSAVDGRARTNVDVRMDIGARGSGDAEAFLALGDMRDATEVTLQPTRDVRGAAIQQSHDKQDIVPRGPRDIRGAMIHGQQSLQDLVRGDEARDLIAGKQSIENSQKAADVVSQDRADGEMANTNNQGRASGNVGRTGGKTGDSRVYTFKAHSDTVPDNRYFSLRDENDAKVDAGRTQSAVIYSHADVTAGPNHETGAESGAHADLHNGRPDVKGATGGDSAGSQIDDAGRVSLHDMAGKSGGRISLDREIKHPDTPPTFREIAQQVVERAALRIRHGDSEMFIQLKPESLGRVHIMVAEEGGSVTIGIRAENGITRNLLEAGLGELRSLLADNGVKVSQVNIAADTGAWDFASGAGGDFSYSRQQSHGAQHAQEAYLREAPISSDRIQLQIGEARVRSPGNSLDRVV